MPDQQFEVADGQTLVNAPAVDEQQVAAAYDHLAGQIGFDAYTERRVVSKIHHGGVGRCVTWSWLGAS